MLVCKIVFYVAVYTIVVAAMCVRCGHLTHTVATTYVFKFCQILHFKLEGDM